MTKLMLWDFDGTMSDDRARQHLYLAGEYKKYFSYESQMSDPVYPEARALFDEMLSDGWEPAYLTARLERNRPASHDWLVKNSFPHPERAVLRPEVYSFMRPPRFKTQVVSSLLKSQTYDEVVLIDNDPLVIDRITDELGGTHVFLAAWGANEPTTSIERAVPVDLN